MIDLLNKEHLIWRPESQSEKIYYNFFFHLAQHLVTLHVLIFGNNAGESCYETVR
jgi:hypothetical protein